MNRLMIKLWGKLRVAGLEPHEGLAISIALNAAKVLHAQSPEWFAKTYGTVGTEAIKQLTKPCQD